MKTIKIPLRAYVSNLSESSTALLLMSSLLVLLEWLSMNLTSISLNSTQEEALGASILSAITTYIKLFVVCITIGFLVKKCAKQHAIQLGAVSSLWQLIKSFFITLVAMTAFSFILSSLVSLLFSGVPNEEGVLIVLSTIAIGLVFAFAYFMVVYQQYLINAVLKGNTALEYKSVNGYKVPFIAVLSIHKVLPVYLFVLIVFVLYGLKGAMLSEGYFNTALFLSVLPMMLLSLMIVKSSEYVLKEVSESIGGFDDEHKRAV